MSQSPLVIGEVLLDHFPDGSHVLGGAPFNVAWNLQGLGLNPDFVSRIGADREGDKIRELMQHWGLSLAGLQIAADQPTAKVQVTLVDGQPEYEILDDQAFDRISEPELAIDPDSHSLVYTGTLALRHGKTRETLWNILRNSGLPCFLDVNMRLPWFGTDWVSDLIRQAKWVKLSEGELAYLTEATWIDDEPSREDVCAAVEKLDQLHIGGTPTAGYFVTLGHRGSCVIAKAGETIWAEPTPPLGGVKDTVGAGDAFVAATIYGLVHDWTLQRTLKFASVFSSRACTLHGATTTDKRHYTDAIASV